MSNDRYEIVKCDGEESTVELWDRTLAPGGLAFEVVESPEGALTVLGHGLAVPLDVFSAFLAEAKAWFRA